MFIGFVMVPALALAIELGRYFYDISAVAKAADAGAVTEINQRTFRDSGTLVSTSKTWANAQSYVSQNMAGFAAKGVQAYVTGIQVSGGDNTIRVNVSANLSVQFPSVVPNVTVTKTGIAKLRALTH